MHPSPPSVDLDTHELRGLISEMKGVLGRAEALLGRLEQASDSSPQKDSHLGSEPETNQGDDDPTNRLCCFLEELHQRWVLERAAVGGDEARFLTKTRPVLAEAGESFPKRLVDILGFLDGLGSKYLGRVYRSLQEDLLRARQLLAAVPAGPHIDLDAFETKGGPILPVSHAIILETPITTDGAIPARSGTVVKPVEASGDGALIWALIEEMWDHLALGWQAGLHAEVLRAIDLWASRKGSALSGEVDALRSVMNAHTRYLERIDTPAVKDALERFRAEGSRQAVIQIGEYFDPEKHDFKIFERVGRKDTAGRPREVIGIRQVGLLDTSGLPQQRCIVVVAE